MTEKLNSASSLNYSIPIVSCILFSMHNGKFTGPYNGFSKSRMKFAELMSRRKSNDYEKSRIYTFRCFVA